MVRATIALLLLIVLHMTAWAQAEKRVALVIGNSAYQHTPTLINPKNDATDMVAALKRHGFQVLDGFDLDKAAFDRKVRDFATALSTAQVGVFFYTGHGLQVSGHNYLVPIDAQLSTASALDFEMVRLDLVHRTMEREAQTNIHEGVLTNPTLSSRIAEGGARRAEQGDCHHRANEVASVTLFRSAGEFWLLDPICSQPTSQQFAHRPRSVLHTTLEPESVDRREFLSRQRDLHSHTLASFLFLHCSTLAGELQLCERLAPPRAGA